MVRQIYIMPLQTIVLIMIAMLLAWSYIFPKFSRNTSVFINGALFCCALAAIFYTTFVYHRYLGEYEVILRPFASLAAAKKQPERYREMLMNVFLFFPMGLTLSNALPKKWRIRRRIGVTAFAAFLLSIWIEIVQYYFAIGTAETDDVLCNALGALIGAMSLFIETTVG